MSDETAGDLPSGARPYRFESDAQLAARWQKLGSPTTLGPVLREFLARYYERCEDESASGVTRSLAPHDAAKPPPLTARQRSWARRRVRARR